ncbi:dentin sialophosphoprotein-like [Seriola lalandi dorsalis]|uniref:Dentin sialophosphoprotein-like n=1 Tax=Seriola lalandi dorsalis TaxID=1841481 RepID=A0A3B4WTD2_SERLL|nr:dentin sialophosphoprotein-like [Seriola lalandi dorsalis]XP_056228270.1 secretory calcium-binding phosphoprotein 1 [Seriola aureovittata]
MKVTIITLCLVGAVFANPISYNVILESSELEANTTGSLSLSQSSENNTSELQSSEENASNQSSESESLESTSEDKTSEESNSQSDEDDGTDSMAETRDNSMGSEENVRKSWVRVFASVTKVLSAEDNSSTEVEGQTDHLSKELTEKQPNQTSTSTIFKQKTNTTQSQTNLLLVENNTDSSDTTSDSADTSEMTGVTSDSSESTSSESNESSDSSDSSDASKSTEDSNASDSTELHQIKTEDCVNGTQSCESEEYFFQAVGDDANYSVDNLMMPDEDERELSLRR